MNNDEDIEEGSDSSDEDYVPNLKEEHAVSEEDTDDNISGGQSDDNENTTNKSNRKRRKKTTKSRKKKIKKADPEPEPEPEPKEEEKSDLTEEEKKKKEDDLWADFMKDTGFKSKSSSSSSSQQIKEKPKTNSTSNSTINKNTETKPVEKVKITQIFEFAGEEVKVEKEVAANSAEARLLSKSETSTSDKRPKPRGGLSGISSVLSQLGKKQKISTLEKSKLDWDKFKKEEKIEEELQTYNKGKNGYLDRQDFLERADLRRFEIERELRENERSKRLNNVL